MKKLIVLCAALALTLATAAPVAANQKVHIGWPHSDSWEFEVPLGDADMGFDCTGPVYYGGYGSSNLWLWYANNVDTTDPDDYMPDGRAWPWIRGESIVQGLDYFSSRPDMGGKVISGKFKMVFHLSDHHLGSAYPTDDLESWHILGTGKAWGIQAPGYGTVFHVSGSEKGIETVVEQVPGPFDITEYVGDGRGYRGNETFMPNKLCAFFGYDVD